MAYALVLLAFCVRGTHWVTCGLFKKDINVEPGRFLFSLARKSCLTNSLITGDLGAVKLLWRHQASSYINPDRQRVYVKTCWSIESSVWQIEINVRLHLQHSFISIPQPSLSQRENTLHMQCLFSLALILSSHAKQHLSIPSCQYKRVFYVKWCELTTGVIIIG